MVTVSGSCYKPGATPSICHSRKRPRVVPSLEELLMCTVAAARPRMAPSGCHHNSWAKWVAGLLHAMVGTDAAVGFHHQGLNTAASRFCHDCELLSLGWARDAPSGLSRFLGCATDIAGPTKASLALLPPLNTVWLPIATTIGYWMCFLCASIEITI